MKDPGVAKIAQTEGKVSLSILDAFDLLKAPKDDVKLTGGVKILTQLQGSESEKDLNYVLKRVVRSLGANVPDLRTGYFGTLVLLLKKIDNLTVSTLLDLVKKELHASGGSKSEVGDVALGQILLCGAIFRSGLILKCSNEEQKEVIQLLVTASKKKSYLNSVAYPILLDFANSLDAEKFSSILWSNLKLDFKKEIKEHSLDSLHFLLIMSKKFPESIKLHKLIGVKDILHDDNIQTVCEKLMSGIDFNTVGHPIYKEIATQIANSPHLKEFWTTIDSQLTKHNRNRELVSINLLTHILLNIKDNAEVIPDLLSPNFFKLLMDWFKGLQIASKIRNKRENEDDNKLMTKKQKELLNTLAKAMKTENVTNEIRVEVLKKLLFDPGEINLTDITGTTVVRSTMADLEKSGVKKMAKLFKGVLLGTSQKTVNDGTRVWHNNERVKAADLLSYLVSHDAVKDDVEFKLTYMKFLMCFGFFKISGQEDTANVAEIAGSIKLCFYRCFTSRFSNVDNLVTVLSSLCNFICNILEKEDVRKKIEKQFPDENIECWQTLMEVCQKIEKSDSKSKIDKVFLILLYQLGLFLFSEPTHVKIARSSIKELKSCYEHYKKGKKKKQKLKDLSDEPEWIEVLVEVLLSILSAESSVLRSVVQCVFRLLWEYLTPSSIGQIVSVLDPESESNPLTAEEQASDVENESDEEKDGSDEEKDDSDEEKDDSDEEKDDSDEEEENGEDKQNGEEGSDEEDSESESEDEDDGDMKTPDQLKIAVQKALGAAGNISDTDSVDADMIDEEEGKKLDEALAEAFKQFHQGKNKKSKKDRKDKKALSDFRIRVLDLIDIYLEKDPSMDVCLGMIAPLTRCLEFCIQDSQFAELENRVRKTIKTLTKIRKFNSTDDVTVDILCDYLKAVIDKGGRSHFLFQALGDIITFFATFIIHCAQKIEERNIKSPKKKKTNSPLVEIFKDSLQSYFRNRNCMLPIIFFHNVLQTEWDSTCDLVPIIIENVFSRDVRHFRKNEGLELIAGFYRALKRSKPSDAIVKKLDEIESTLETSMAVALNNELQVKNNFFVVLRKLINTIKQFHESTHVESTLDFKSILDAVSKCKGTVKVNKQQKVEGQNQQKEKSKAKNKKVKKRKHAQAQTNGHSEPQKTKRARKDSNQ